MEGGCGMTAPRPLSEIRPVPRRGLSREEAAMYIGISPTKFDELVTAGGMPTARRIGTRRIWDVWELDLAFNQLPREDGASDTAPADGWEDFDAKGAANGNGQAPVRAGVRRPHR